MSVTDMPALPPNRLFEAETLARLLRPDTWNLVAPGIAVEVDTVDDPRHRAWMRAHTHAHAHQEILVPLAGNCCFGLAERVYPCTPGAFFVIDAFVAHDIQYPEGTPDLDHLWVSVLRDHCVARRVAVRDRGALISSLWHCLIPREEAGPLLDLSREAAGVPAAVARLRLLGALSLLAGAIARHGYREEQAEERHAFQERIVRSVCEHIEHTAGNGATLEHLARIAGYSPYHFLRLFKEHTGCTVHEYIDRCRLRRAREMEERGASRKEIAAALGFSCPSAFSRWFRGKRVLPSR